jgi:hypothetical protein
MSQVVAFAEAAEVHADGFAEGPGVTGLGSERVFDRLVPDFAITSAAAEIAF